MQLTRQSEWMVRRIHDVIHLAIIPRHICSVNNRSRPRNNSKSNTSQFIKTSLTNMKISIVTAGALVLMGSGVSGQSATSCYSGAQCGSPNPVTNTVAQSAGVCNVYSIFCWPGTTNPQCASNSCSGKMLYLYGTGPDIALAGCDAKNICAGTSWYGLSLFLLYLYISFSFTLNKIYIIIVEPPTATLLMLMFGVAFPEPCAEPNLPSH